MTFGGIGTDGGTCPKASGGTLNSNYWCIGEKINNVTTGDILDNNAQMVVMVGLPTSATPNTIFSINFQPSVGAVLPVPEDNPRWPDRSSAPIY